MLETPFSDLLLSTALAGAGAQPRGDSALEAALERMSREARQEHPEVLLPTEDFIRHLAKHLPRAVSPLSALAGLDGRALFLCCACGRGDAAAIAKLERVHLGKARAAVRRIQGPVTLADDVEQTLREILFFRGKDGQEPKIAKYGGRGDLGSWLRTVAMRAALELVDPGREIASPDEALASAGGRKEDPELELIKAEYGARFKRALEEALRALPEDSRRDVRRYYFEAMGVEAMAESDGVSVSTISRRLARARELLLRKIREVLERKLAMSAREIDSILRVVRTQVEISRSALGEALPDPASASRAPRKRRRRTS